MKRLLGACLWLGLVMAAGACSSEESCVDTCEEAQTRDCTSIKGDCARFCEAAFNIEDESGCGDEREAYQDCMDASDTCNNSCDALENDLSSCLGAYCMTRANTPDCQTLISSF